MSKKYGWKNWKDRLFGSILVPENDNTLSIGINDDKENTSQI